MTKLNIVTKDPFDVLNSTKKVLEKAQLVTLDPQKIPGVFLLIKEKILRGLEKTEEHFGTTGNFQKAVQLIFLEDAVNFCFGQKREGRNGR